MKGDLLRPQLLPSGQQEEVCNKLNPCGTSEAKITAKKDDYSPVTHETAGVSEVGGLSGVQRKGV